MRLLLPQMIARGEGRILNVASIAAFMPMPQLAVYAAAKAYVLSLTEAVGEELKGTGVTATALCPGFTDTAMMRGSALGRPIPATMIMSAKAVAEAGCAACLKGEAIAVPGLANKLITGGAPLAPEGAGARHRRRDERRRLGAPRRPASGPRRRTREGGDDRHQGERDHHRVSGLRAARRAADPARSWASACSSSPGRIRCARVLPRAASGSCATTTATSACRAGCPAAGRLRTSGMLARALLQSAGAAALYARRHGARRGRADGRIGIGAAHVVGASMGGMIAQIVAAEHPDRVRSLTSIMSSPAPIMPRPKVLRALLRPPPRDRDQAIRRMTTSSGWSAARAIRRPTRSSRSRSTARCAAASGRTASPASSSPSRPGRAACRMLHRVRAPTLVLHGSDDPLVPLIGGTR